jgi:hypothetical protein
MDNKTRSGHSELTEKDTDDLSKLSAKELIKILPKRFLQLLIKLVSWKGIMVGLGTFLVIQFDGIEWAWAVLGGTIAISVFSREIVKIAEKIVEAKFPKK